MRVIFRIIVIVFAVTAAGCSLRNSVDAFVILGARGIGSIDPHYIKSTGEERIVHALFEGLVTADPKTGEPMPGLAESWQMSADGLKYSFSLRKAVWSDGIRISAQTVVDSWLRCLDPQTASPVSWYPGMFIKGAGEFLSGSAGPEAVGIRALDDYTFQVELARPMPHFLQAMVHHSLLVIPVHRVEKYGFAWVKPENFAGNGAFIPETWEKGGDITLVKNDQYRGRKKVALTQVNYRVVPDVEAAFRMFLDGDADWISDLPEDLPAALRESDALYTAPGLENYYLLVNNEMQPFDDPRVRRALALGFDRNKLLGTVCEGRHLPAYSIVPGNLPGYSEIPLFEDSAAEAKILLEVAGFPEGKGFPVFTILYNRSDFNRTVLEFICDSWRENLNLRCEPVSEEWGSYLITRRLHNFSLARAGWMGDFPDPLAFLAPFISTHENNDGLYRNLAFDEAILKAADKPYGKERFEHLAQAERILIDDMGAIPVLFRASAHIVDTEKWDGWHTNIRDLHPLSGIRPR
jgi:oligopeptide transport system substrate-binding protein